MKKRRSVGVAIVLLLLIPLVCFAETIALTSEQKIEQSALNKTNAAIVYKESIADLKDIPENLGRVVMDILKNGWVGEHNDLKEFLSQNKKYIEAFKKANKLEYCDFKIGKPPHPLYPSDYNVPKQLFTCVRLILLEARLYEKENKWDQALDDYISLLRLKNHFDQEDLMFYSIQGSVIEGFTYLPLTQFLNRSDLSLQQAKKLFDTLLFLRENRAGIDKLYEREAEFAKNSIRIYGEVAKEQGKYNTPFYQTFYKAYDSFIDELLSYQLEAIKKNKPNIIKRKCISFREALEKEPLQIMNSHDKDIFKKLENYDPEWYRDRDKVYKYSFSLPDKIYSCAPASLAKILASHFCRSIKKYPEFFTRLYILRVKSDILLTANAIRLYEITNGKTLINLESLVPDYFSALPEDPFNDFKPIKYKKKKEGWVVYSFGPDKRDNKAKLIYSEFYPPHEKGDICFFSG